MTNAKSYTKLAALSVGTLLVAGVAAYAFWGSSAGIQNRLHVIQTDNPVVAVHIVLPNPNTTPGLMHYVEHLAWLNTFNGQDRGADRHSNAWTNSTAVAYYLTGTADDLDDTIARLTTVFDPITLPHDFADEERGIVLREYDFSVSNNPDRQAHEAMNAFLYAGNATANSVIGTRSDIMALDYETARSHHAETHLFENAAYVVTGDVPPQTVRRMMQDLRITIPQDPLKPASFKLAPADTTQLTFAQTAAAPRILLRKVVALDMPIPFDLLEAETALLRDILVSNVPGGMAGPLRFDATVTRSFSISIWPLDTRHIELSFSAAPDRGTTLTDIQNAFIETLDDIAATGIPDASYDRILGRFDGYWPDWDDAEETADWMAAYTLNRVSDLQTPLSKRDLQAIEKQLSPTTTQTLLTQLSGEARMAIAFIGPQEVFDD